MIPLNIFLKKKGLAHTGGQAKLLIRSGAVLVNGHTETRNKKQLAQGDSVMYDGKTYTVTKEDAEEKEQ